MKNEQELLEVALGHIADIAGDGRPARRLDWIVARAKTALRGEEFDHRYIPHPIRQKTIEMAELRTQCDALREMLENLINRAATGSPEHSGQDIDRARAIVEQNWHHIKRYREKQNNERRVPAKEWDASNGEAS